MSISHEQRTNPSEQDLEQDLAALLEANRAGQLVGLVFMLKHGDKALVDYRGSHEMVEIATRTARERIAQFEEAHNPEIAAAIREELDRAGRA